VALIEEMLNMSRPIEQLASLAIGTVESVSPTEIRVLLDPGAPQATALNTGTPIGFPRINGYLLIPNETGAVVGLIVWLGVERSDFPRRTGLKDYGLVDLPFPLRKIALTPLGTLVAHRGHEEDSPQYALQRGVVAFPSVGDTAYLPTAEQLRSIIEAPSDADRRVEIGTSPLSAGSSVTVDPDKLFGRHLAVLGNTGSGKSCSVAGVLRWSLQQARAARSDARPANARFIVLDPNGEYSSAFADEANLRTFRVPAHGEDGRRLCIPAWMWNSEEWAAFSRAAAATQRPILLQALRDMRAGVQLTEPSERRCARSMRSYLVSLQARVARGVSGYQGFPENKNCGNQLRNLSEDALRYADQLPAAESDSLRRVAAEAENVAEARHWTSPNSEGYNDFSETEVLQVVDALTAALAELPLSLDDSGVSEDAPVPFELSAFPDHIDQVAANSPGGQTAQFLATLTMRIRMMLADPRLGPILNPAEDAPTFEQWLDSYIGEDQAAGGELAIIDLSLVPSDVLHICIAVIARVVFEACQRYRKACDCELPVALVLEEAHTFVKRGSDEDEGQPSASQMCRRVFERIAREGRKFGLGLVLSSQRPSELSPTVLAQCNTFLLHRIVNDQDQELVRKLVPDNLAGLLKELPSLPTRQAILLGWAVSVPTLVEMRELPESQRPRAPDPEFWRVWTGEEERRIDWSQIAESWTGMCAPADEEEVEH